MSVQMHEQTYIIFKYCFETFMYMTKEGKQKSGQESQVKSHSCRPRLCSVTGYNAEDANHLTESGDKKTHTVSILLSSSEYPIFIITASFRSR